MFRHLLIFRSGTPIIRIRINGNATARGENPRNFNILGIHQANEVFHDDIHAILMKSAMIAKTEKVKFQALTLHHFHIGNVTDTDFRKIRLPRYRTQAGELRTVETYPIIVIGMLVVKRFQYFGRICLLGQL